MAASFRRAALAACGFLAISLTEPAHARAVAREDFAFPSDRVFKIVVFRPDVHVGSLKIGGVDEPNADWTDAARNHMQAAMKAAPEVQNSNIVFLEDADGPDADLLQTYRGMFELVAGAMFTHVTNPGNDLPTKVLSNEKDPVTARRVKKYKVDWTLGEGAATLRQATGADYAMFVFTHDSYGDSGRKAAQALGMLGCVIGACVIVQAGVHIGYAGLVDLSTGNIVWFNSDLAMGGDVRDSEGAVKRVEQLLRGFPVQTAPSADLVASFDGTDAEPGDVAGDETASPATESVEDASESVDEVTMQAEDVSSEVAADAEAK